MACAYKLVCKCVCLSVCLSICMYVCMHIYIYPPTPLGRRPEVRLASASVPLCATRLNPANAADPKTASASALASASVPLCATLLNPANAADPKTASASVPLCATLLNPANAADPKTEGRRRQRDPQCRSAQEEAQPLNDPKQAHLVAYPASENISQIDSLELSRRLLSSEVACVSQCMPNPSPALTGPTRPTRPYSTPLGPSPTCSRAWSQCMPNPSPTPLSPNRPYSALLGPTRPEPATWPILVARADSLE